MTCMSVYRPYVQPRRLHTAIDHGTNSLCYSDQTKVQVSIQVAVHPVRNSQEVSPRCISVTCILVQAQVQLLDHDRDPYFRRSGM